MEQIQLGHVPLLFATTHTYMYMHMHTHIYTHFLPRFRGPAMLWISSHLRRKSFDKGLILHIILEKTKGWLFNGVTTFTFI